MMIILNDVIVKLLLLVTFRADLTILGGLTDVCRAFPRNRDFGYILIESRLIDVDALVLVTTFGLSWGLE